MKMPIWTKPAIWGGVFGAVAIASIGFSSFGWTTSTSANRMADDRASTAVVGALVPFCVAMAKADTDAARMTKLRGETSSYSRSDIVRTSGWATMPGMTAPDYNLATACSERLTTAS